MNRLARAIVATALLVIPLEMTSSTADAAVVPNMFVCSTSNGYCYKTNGYPAGSQTVDKRYPCKIVKWVNYSIGGRPLREIRKDCPYWV